MAIKESPSRQLRYRQAMSVLEQQIRTGRFGPGERLPAMRELSSSLDMNMLTVRKALKELAAKGVVDIRHGSGTFVSEKNRKSASIDTLKLGLALREYVLRVDSHHTALGTYLAGAQRVAQEHNARILPLFYEENQFVADLGQSLVDEQVDGVLVAMGRLNDQDYDFLSGRNIPAVAIKHVRSMNGACGSVVVDRLGALDQAVAHLYGLGHKHIALITYARTQDDGAVAHHFAELAYDYRLDDPRTSTIYLASTGTQTDWMQIEDVFTIRPYKTAIIVHDEYMIDFFLECCERRGLGVPEDISLVAIQDAKPYGHRMPVTSTHSSNELVRAAEIGTDMLLKRIRGEEIREPHVVLTPRLVTKASSARAPDRMPGVTST